ncbi:hypothetical protein BH09PLA1_BH09PLA1_23080 [soil metagenome]
MKLANRMVMGLTMLCLSIGVTALAAEALDSGLNVGENAPAFDPTHISGADRGTSACPMCKYGDGQGVMIWLNTENLTDAAAMAKRLEREIQARGVERMRAFIMYMNPGGKSDKELKKMLGEFSSTAGLQKVAVTFIPAPTDPDTAGVYKINADPKVKNTVLVYHQRKVIEKHVNMGSTDAEMDQIVNAIDRAANAK